MVCLETRQEVYESVMFSTVKLEQSAKVCNYEYMAIQEITKPWCKHCQNDLISHTINLMATQGYTGKITISYKKAVIQIALLWPKHISKMVQIIQYCMA